MNTANRHGFARWAAITLLTISIAGGGVASAEAPKTGDESDARIPVIILKIEGDGIANVRKHSGIVESAAARGKVFSGDRIITDSRSAVHLLLNDGSIVKVGFDSEFMIQKVENRQRYLSWAFKLLQGSLRALVEKVPAIDTHVLVETPSGTIGVRGTEFVAIYDRESERTELFMMEGLVSYGQPGCLTSKRCLDVKTGEMSTLAKGAEKPTAPHKYGVKELLALAPAAGGKGPGPGTSADARLSLFREARKAQSKTIQSLDEANLNKLVQEASSELAAAQDRAIGRAKDQREAQLLALKTGTFDDTITAADAYAEKKGLFHRKSNNGAENLVAQVEAAKFRLGEAVKKAAAAGVFAESSDKSSAGKADWDSRDFKSKKTFDYQQSAEAKKQKEALDQALDDYRGTLEYSEALSAEQVSAGDAKDLKTDSTEGSEAGGKKKAPPIVAAVDPGNCNTVSCMSERIAHEVDVASEGVVNAYANKKTDEGNGNGKGKRQKGVPSNSTTKYFTRVIPGDSCFKPQANCHMQTCKSFGKGKTCRPGESVQVCDTKMIPVRCREK